MKVRYEKQGGHYHCTVFTAKLPNQTYANCGNLVFSEEEFDAVRGIMSGAWFEKKETTP